MDADRAQLKRDLSDALSAVQEHQSRGLGLLVSGWRRFSA
jgi:hypothetical protein